MTYVNLGIYYLNVQHASSNSKWRKNLEFAYYEHRKLPLKSCRKTATGIMVREMHAATKMIHYIPSIGPYPNSIHLISRWCHWHNKCSSIPSLSILFFFIYGKFNWKKEQWDAGRRETLRLKQRNKSAGC